MMVATSELPTPSVRYYVDRMEDRWAIYRGSRPLVIYRNRDHAVARCEALTALTTAPERRARIPRIQILHFEAREMALVPGRTTASSALPPAS